MLMMQTQLFGRRRRLCVRCWVDLVGRKFQLAKALEEHVEGTCTVTELGSHTTDDGEEVDVSWCQCEGPGTGDARDEFSDIEERGGPSVGTRARREPNRRA
jgi:hypothetical protein